MRADAHRVKRRADWCRRILVTTITATFCTCISLSAQQAAPLFSPSMSASPSTSQNTGGSGQNASAGGSAAAGLGLDNSSDLSTNDEEQAVRPDSARISETDTSAPLSASRIFAVLQQNPDAVIELKSLMADASQQQGTPVQADSITDQMLYSKIASSPELRANITTFLRARGYLAGDALQSYSDGDNGDFVDLSPEFERTRDLDANSSALLYDPRSDSYTGAQSARQYSSGRSKPAAVRKRTLNGSTGEPQVLHQPAPYNMLALRDLYTQLPEQNGPLKRFGSNVFLARGGYAQAFGASAGRAASLDIPASPDYVVGPGDALTISLWGGISQSLTRTIDRDGKVSLPEAGPVQVSGLTLERVRGVITDALKHQYRDAQVAVTVARLRSIRVYVVGDVQRPGAYDISSLSTSLAALIAAGGPTATGSLRLLRHYRGQQLIGEIDLYDFLLHGVQSEDRLQSGDTLVVPPSGPQVSVYGAVKRPAIYELKGETTLAAVLQDAGGVTVSAALGHIVIDRINANRERETVSLNLTSKTNVEEARTAIASFAVHDGDHVHVSAVLPYSQKVVYTDGHVVRPGRMPYHDGMQLSDVLHSYRDLLPEPADRGEIVRLRPPDLHPETIDFSVPEVLIGNSNIALEPFDTIRVFGRYEADAPKVTIGGEVLRPGSYALTRGMTAAQLVRMAGGFKRDALLTDADLTSYQVVGGTKVVSERVPVHIGNAVTKGDQNADVPLKAGDVLMVHQLTGWNDIGSSITVEGEVAHPGSYGFKQGEHLSSILRRAGGFRDTSYPAGAVLIREEVRQLEEKTREELIHQIETSSASARISPNLGSGDTSGALQLIAQQQNDVLSRLRSQPATGRMVIHINADITSWENTPADIEVRTGDVLRIPKRPGFVLISGQVYNASAITYAPGKTAAWYLRHAGGATEIANKKEIFIIRANGSVVGHESGMWLDHNVLSTRLEPGDAVVVPQKIIGASLFWRNLLTVAQITSSIAVTAAVAGVI
jgi:protein involved in polysaccharide export with SLBB domain